MREANLCERGQSVRERPIALIDYWLLISLPLSQNWPLSPLQLRSHEFVREADLCERGQSV